MDDTQYDAEVLKITTLAEEEAPTSNVFKKKHEARSLMTDLRTKLTDLCKAAQGSDTHDALLTKLVRTNIMITSNLFEVESMSDGYEYLERAELMIQALRNKAAYDWEKGFLKDQLEKLDHTKFSGASDDVIDHAYTPLTLEIFNLAGYYFCGCGKTKQAISILEHSEKIYHDFDVWAKRQGDEGVQSLKVSDAGEEKTGAEHSVLRASIESSYTSTLFYLAQVYGNDSNADQASKYCHLTLHRQLASKKEFDRLEWSINALGLCSFYLSHNNYGASYHCIEASELVMNGFVEQNTTTVDGKLVPNSKDVDEEKMRQTIANIDQAYAKWHYYLVKYYRDVHSGMTEDEEPTPPECFPVEWWISFPDISEPAQPPPIPMGLEGWPMVLDYFHKAEVRYHKSMEWYDFDGFVTDNIQIQQDRTTFLKLLVSWDLTHDKTDPFGVQIDRHVAIHKARAKLLEHIPQSVSVKHYLNFCRQCWFELGEIYNEICDLRIKQRANRKKIKEGSALSKKAINKLVRKARTFFENWVNSFNDEEGNVPEALDPDVCQAYVSARMHAVRLGTKKYASSAEEEYKQLQVTTVEYKELVEWAENHPNWQEKLIKDDSIRLQIELSKEMVRLLPTKMRDIEVAFRGK